MKFSQAIHIVAIVVGVAAALALLGAWMAGSTGTFLSLSQGQLFQNATVLTLLAILLSINSRYHQWNEPKR